MKKIICLGLCLFVLFSCFGNDLLGRYTNYQDLKDAIENNFFKQQLVFEDCIYYHGYFEGIFCEGILNSKDELFVIQFDATKVSEQESIRVLKALFTTFGLPTKKDGDNIMFSDCCMFVIDNTAKTFTIGLTVVK